MHLCAAVDPPIEPHAYIILFAGYTEFLAIATTWHTSTRTSRPGMLVTSKTALHAVTHVQYVAAGAVAVVVPPNVVLPRPSRTETGSCRICIVHHGFVEHPMHACFRSHLGIIQCIGKSEYGQQGARATHQQCNSTHCGRHVCPNLGCRDSLSLLDAVLLRQSAYEGVEGVNHGGGS